MATTLLLQVASDHLVLTAAPGKPGFWKKSSGAPAFRGSAPLHESRWAAALEACLEDFAKRGGELRGAQLVVRFGAMVSHLGVMNVVGDSVVLQDSHVHAWAEQTWAMDTAAWAVRKSRSANSSHYTVSAIHAQALTELQQVCEAHKARLVSALPAVVEACGPNDEVIVGVERLHGGARYPCVQILAVQAGQLKGTWRGWMPSATDAEIAGMVQRFMVAHDMETATPMRWFDWPNVQVEGALA
jgi:hypothetical protein